MPHPFFDAAASNRHFAQKAEPPEEVAEPLADGGMVCPACGYCMGGEVAEGPKTFSEALRSRAKGKE